MKSILITTDFSSDSKYTIEYVINFMNETKIPCRILLLNTYLLPKHSHQDNNDLVSTNDELRRKSQENLIKEKQIAENILKNHDISIETASHFGTLKNVVFRLIKKEKFDFVAMGKDGGKHVESIAALLKEQECPLLITYHHKESKNKS